uniref:Uncharacterized protein n=1 Tax=Rhizophora mucronata TaxID=61149 RepID=A0A2P2PL62_RHIMU
MLFALLHVFQCILYIHLLPSFSLLVSFWCFYHL